MNDNVLIKRKDGKLLFKFIEDKVNDLYVILEKDIEGKVIVAFNREYINNKSYENRDLKLLVGLDIKRLFLLPEFDNYFSNIEVVYSFKNLIELVNWDNGLKIDFQYLNKLEALECSYNPRLKNFFTLVNLTYLKINRYSSKSIDLEEFRAFANLSELYICFTKIQSINGLQSLKNLKKLTIRSAPKLEINLNDNLNPLYSVEELWLDSCKKVTFDFVKLFPNLKKLDISGWGNIETVKPILKALPKLEKFSIGDGTTIMEHDNRYFNDYPKIKEFFFVEKKWHKLKLKDLGKKDKQIEIPKAKKNKEEKLEFPIFGEIDINNLEKSYEVNYRNKKLNFNCELHFQHDDITLKEVETIKEFIENCTNYNDQNLLYLKQKLLSKDLTVIKDFLDLHIEEVGELLSIKTNTQSKELKMLNKLILTRIGIYLNSKSVNAFYAVFDYKIKDDLTDEILVVYTNHLGEISSVTWES